MSVIAYGCHIYGLLAHYATVGDEIIAKATNKQTNKQKTRNMTATVVKPYYRDSQKNNNINFQRCLLMIYRLDNDSGKENIVQHFTKVLHVSRTQNQCCSSPAVSEDYYVLGSTHRHTDTHARTHARTHAHAHTHTHTHSRVIYVTSV